MLRSYFIWSVYLPFSVRVPICAFISFHQDKRYISYILYVSFLASPASRTSLEYFRYLCWRSCVGGPPLHPQVWQFARRNHKIQHIIIQLKFTSAKGNKARSAKGRGTWGKVQGKPGVGFKSPPCGVTQVMLCSSSIESRQHMWHVVAKKAHEIVFAPGFSWGQPLCGLRVQLPGESRHSASATLLSGLGTGSPLGTF